MTESSAPNLMREPYLEWVRREGLPVVEDFGVDLFAVQPKPWARYEVDGAAVHLKGRGDFISMFVLELAAGGASARMVCTTSLPAVLNMFHNPDFVFNNPWDFNERMGGDKYFSGEGDFIPIRPGNHMWETNFVPDLGAIELKEWADRGALVRVDWKHGTVFAPPDQMFHQHFNTNSTPARYLATAFGSLRYPFTESKRKSLFGGVSTSVKLGGAQIEYEDQSPRIAQLYEEATRKNGVEVRMSQFAIPRR